MVAAAYMEGLADSGLGLPLATGVSATSLESHVWHLFVIRTKNREELQNKLAEQGVQTLIHYPIAPHKQLAYSDFSNLSFPITEAIHGEVLSLPIGPKITDQELSVVVAAVNSSITQYKKSK